MKNKVLDELIKHKELQSEENKEHISFQELINSIVESPQFNIFEGIVNDAQESYFVRDQVHGINHNYRVCILAMAIAIKEGVSDSELKVLIESALYHDIGRKTETGKEHGIESARIIEENKATLAQKFNYNQFAMVKFLCAMHSGADEKSKPEEYEKEFKEHAEQFGISDMNQARKLLNIMKDADALDRVRLPRFGKLDSERLRTESAKDFVQAAKDLFMEFRNVQYEQGSSTNLSVFDIQHDAVIEDEENIYIFRNLNDDNVQDMENPEIDVIRTKGSISAERSNDRLTSAKSDESISLEEVFNTIRVAKSGKKNNCVPFSLNPNVNLDYVETAGRYIMYTVPKKDLDKSVYPAAKYMLTEMDKRIAHKIRNAKNIDDELLSILQQIDSETSSENIMELVSKSYDLLRARSESDKRYSGEKLSSVKYKSQIVSRFEQKQGLTEEQQLEYNRIIAKLSIMEAHGITGSLINTQANNGKLIGTLGGAISSCEVIYHGDIPKDKVATVPKEIMQALALVAQMQSIEGIDKVAVNQLKLLLLDAVKNHEEFTVNEQTHEFDTVNGTSISPIDITDALKIDDSIIIPYQKGSTAISFIQNYAMARVKTQNLLEIIKTSSVINNEYRAQIISLLDSAQDRIIIPDGSIVGRRNNQGIPLSGPVNIDANPDKEHLYFSKDEQSAMIDAVKNLPHEDLVKIANGDLETIKSSSILANCLDNQENYTNINEYYINYIIENMNLDKIYTVYGNESTKVDRIKTKMRELLQNVDVEKIYKALSGAGVEADRIPNYITNLILENGYGDYSFQELDELDNPEDFFSKIKGNLNYRITSSSIDKFVEDENENIVPGTLIKLREYQKLTLNGVQFIFENHRFAGVVLPTGAGKSFVSLAEMMEFQNKKIIYFAPQEEILRQFQMHIVKHILNKSVINEKDVESMLSMNPDQRAEFLKDKIYNRGINIKEQLDALNRADISEDEKKQIIKSFLPRRTEKYNDIMEEIQTVFPHLEMHCYQTLNGSEYDKLLEANADLVVLDELHRTGAETWQPLIKNFLDKNENAKILGVTATPVRDTVTISSDGSRERDMEAAKDMMLYMAKNFGGYTEEELHEKAYLASDMSVITAMQNRYVVEPRIVSFSFTLKETEQYKYVTEQLEMARQKDPNSELTKTLQELKNSMDEIINNGVDKPENDIEALGAVFSEQITEQIKNGKFIVFLPNKPSGYKGSTEQYIQEKIEEINKAFTGANPEITSKYLLSNRRVKSDNIEAIETFENLDDDTLKLLYAINMLNEGTHVNGINGEVMLRRIGKGSNILYLQQIGRVIFAIDPDNPPKEDQIPIIFDVYNNYLTRDLDRYANTTLPTSDLGNIQIIKNWINSHERTPDINSENQDEARKAIQLKKIQEKYLSYFEKIQADGSLEINIQNLSELIKKQNSNLSNSEAVEISKILKIAIDIELFDMEIGERNVLPGERELGRVTAFEVKGEVKKFLECFKQSKKSVKKSENKEQTVSHKSSGESTTENVLRIRETIKIMQVLSEYGVEISIQKINELDKKLYPERWEDKRKTNYDFEMAENCKLTLEQIIKELAPEKLHEKIMRDLDMDEWDVQNCFIGKDFFYARKAFKRADMKLGRAFEIYDVTELRRIGLISKENDVYRGEFISEYAPKMFRHINIFTGTKYDEEGYDYRGYDAEGYDKDGYNEDGYDREGFNRLGITKYKFDKEGKNIKTGNHLTSNFFDFEGFYWEADPKFPDDVSKRRKTNKKVDDQGKNIDNKYVVLDESANTVLLDDHFFDEKGIYWKPNPEFPGDKLRRISTGSKINDEFFDAKGYYYKDGTKKTKHRYNDDGWDFDHYYHKKSNNGSRYTQASGMYDDDGYNYYGLDSNRFNRDHLYVDEDGNTSSVNPVGIGYNGNTWEYDEDKGEYVDTGVRVILEDGYDANGLDENFFDRDHYYHELMPNGSRAGKSLRKYDDYGFDYRHLHQGIEGALFDEREFDWQGYYKGIPGRKYDDKFFDRDGYFYELNPETNEYEKTNRIVNNENFDYNGFFYRKLPDGTYQKTEYKTNEEGRDINGNLVYDRQRMSSWNFEKRMAVKREIREEKAKLIAEMKAVKEAEKAKKLAEKEARRKAELKAAAIKREKEREERLQEKADKLNAAKEEFRKKFDENGRCTSNFGLPYDENFFDVNGRHVVTKTNFDLRGFDCFGRYPKNNFEMWDRNGFMQDGTHHKTGEMYYNGYNAYGVDKDGKNRRGEIAKEITMAKKYIQALFDPKEKGELNAFVTEQCRYNGWKTIKIAVSNLKMILFKACEMYPALKTEVQEIIQKQRELLERYYKLLEQKKSEANQNQSLISMYEKMIDSSKKMLGYISYEEGEK